MLQLVQTRSVRFTLGGDDDVHLMGAVTMPLEHEMAELLTGHHFFLHSENPGLGILRLDAKGDRRWWLVTRQDLLALSKACAKYAEELQEANPA
jgi:hypothetical protein